MNEKLKAFLGNAKGKFLKFLKEGLMSTDTSAVKSLVVKLLFYFILIMLVQSILAFIMLITNIKIKGPLDSEPKVDTKCLARTSVSSFSYTANAASCNVTGGTPYNRLDGQYSEWCDTGLALDGENLVIYASGDMMLWPTAKKELVSSTVVNFSGDDNNKVVKADIKTTEDFIACVNNTSLDAIKDDKLFEGYGLYRFKNYGIGKLGENKEEIPVTIIDKTHYDSSNPTSSKFECLEENQILNFSTKEEDGKKKFIFAKGNTNSPQCKEKSNLEMAGASSCNLNNGAGLYLAIARDSSEIETNENTPIYSLENFLIRRNNPFTGVTTTELEPFSLPKMYLNPYYDPESPDGIDYVDNRNGKVYHNIKLLPYPRCCPEGVTNCYNFGNSCYNQNAKTMLLTIKKQRNDQKPTDTEYDDIIDKLTKEGKLTTQAEKDKFNKLFGLYSGNSDTASLFTEIVNAGYAMEGLENSEIDKGNLDPKLYGLLSPLESYLPYQKGIEQKLFVKVYDSDYQDNSGDVKLLFSSGVKRSTTGQATQSESGFFQTLSDKIQSIVYGDMKTYKKENIATMSDKEWRDGQGFVRQVRNGILENATFQTLKILLLILTVSILGARFLLGMGTMNQKDLLNLAFAVGIVMAMTAPADEAGYHAIFDYIIMPGIFGIINGTQAMFTDAVSNVSGVVVASDAGVYAIFGRMITAAFSEDIFNKIMGLFWVNKGVLIVLLPFVYIGIFILIIMILKIFIKITVALMLLSISLMLAPLFIVFHMMPKEAFGETFKSSYTKWMKYTLIESPLNLVLYQFIGALLVAICYSFFNKIFDFEACWEQIGSVDFYLIKFYMYGWKAHGESDVLYNQIGLSSLLFCFMILISGKMLTVSEQLSKMLGGDAFSGSGSGVLAGAGALTGQLRGAALQGVATAKDVTKTMGRAGLDIGKGVSQLAGNSGKNFDAASKRMDIALDTLEQKIKGAADFGANPLEKIKSMGVNAAVDRLLKTDSGIMGAAIKKLANTAPMKTILGADTKKLLDAYSNNTGGKANLEKGIQDALKNGASPVAARESAIKTVQTALAANYTAGGMVGSAASYRAQQEATKMVDKMIARNGGIAEAAAGGSNAKPFVNKRVEEMAQKLSENYMKEGMKSVNRDIVSLQSRLGALANPNGAEAQKINGEIAQKMQELKNLPDSVHNRVLNDIKVGFQASDANAGFKFDAKGQIALESDGAPQKAGWMLAQLGADREKQLAESGITPDAAKQFSQFFNEQVNNYVKENFDQVKPPAGKAKKVGKVLATPVVGAAAVVGGIAKALEAGKEMKGFARDIGGAVAMGLYVPVKGGSGDKRIKALTGDNVMKGAAVQDMLRAINPAIQDNIAGVEKIRDALDRQRMPITGSTGSAVPAQALDPHAGHSHANKDVAGKALTGIVEDAATRASEAAAAAIGGAGGAIGKASTSKPALKKASTGQTPIAPTPSVEPTLPSGYDPMMARDTLRAMQLSEDLKQATDYQREIEQEAQAIENGYYAQIDEVLELERQSLSLKRAAKSKIASRFKNLMVQLKNGKGKDAFDECFAGVASDLRELLGDRISAKIEGKATQREASYQRAVSRMHQIEERRNYLAGERLVAADRKAAVEDKIYGRDAQEEMSEEILPPMAEEQQSAGKATGKKKGGKKSPTRAKMDQAAEILTKASPSDVSSLRDSGYSDTQIAKMLSPQGAERPSAAAATRPTASEEDKKMVEAMLRENGFTGMTDVQIKERTKELKAEEKKDVKAGRTLTPQEKSENRRNDKDRAEKAVIAKDLKETYGLKDKDVAIIMRDKQALAEVKAVLAKAQDPAMAAELASMVKETPKPEAPKSKLRQAVEPARKAVVENIVKPVEKKVQEVFGKRAVVDSKKPAVTTNEEDKQTKAMLAELGFNEKQINTLIRDPKAKEEVRSAIAKSEIAELGIATTASQTAVAAKPVKPAMKPVTPKGAPQKAEAILPEAAPVAVDKAKSITTERNVTTQKPMEMSDQDQKKMEEALAIKYDFKQEVIVKIMSTPENLRATEALIDLQSKVERIERLGNDKLGDGGSAIAKIVQNPKSLQKAKEIVGLKKPKQVTIVDPVSKLGEIGNKTDTMGLQIPTVQREATTQQAMKMSDQDQKKIIATLEDYKVEARVIEEIKRNPESLQTVKELIDLQSKAEQVREVTKGDLTKETVSQIIQDPESIKKINETLDPLTIQRDVASQKSIEMTEADQKKMVDTMKSEYKIDDVTISSVTANPESRQAVKELFEQSKGEQQSDIAQRSITTQKPELDKMEAVYAEKPSAERAKIPEISDKEKEQIITKIAELGIATDDPKLMEIVMKDPKAALEIKEKLEKYEAQVSKLTTKAPAPITQTTPEAQAKDQQPTRPSIIPKLDLDKVVQRGSEGDKQPVAMSEAQQQQMTDMLKQSTFDEKGIAEVSPTTKPSIIEEMQAKLQSPTTTEDTTFQSITKVAEQEYRQEVINDRMELAKSYVEGTPVSPSERESIAAILEVRAEQLIEEYKEKYPERDSEKYKAELAENIVMIMSEPEALQETKNMLSAGIIPGELPEYPESIKETQREGASSVEADADKQLEQFAEATTPIGFTEENIAKIDEEIKGVTEQRFEEALDRQFPQDQGLTDVELKVLQLLSSPEELQNIEISPQERDMVKEIMGANLESINKEIEAYNAGEPLPENSILKEFTPAEVREAVNEILGNEQLLKEFSQELVPYEVEVQRAVMTETVTTPEEVIAPKPSSSWGDDFGTPTVVEQPTASTPTSESAPEQSHIGDVRILSNQERMEQMMRIANGESGDIPDASSDGNFNPLAGFIQKRKQRIIDDTIGQEDKTPGSSRKAPDGVASATEAAQHSAEQSKASSKTLATGQAEPSPFSFSAGAVAGAHKELELQKLKESFASGAQKADEAPKKIDDQPTKQQDKKEETQAAPESTAQPKKTNQPTQVGSKPYGSMFGGGGGFSVGPKKTDAGFALGGGNMLENLILGSMGQDQLVGGGVDKDDEKKREEALAKAGITKENVQAHSNAPKASPAPVAAPSTLTNNSGGNKGGDKTSGS